MPAGDRGFCDPKKFTPESVRQAKRPSCLGLVALLRKAVIRHPQAVLPLGMFLSRDHSIAAAAA